MAQIPIALQLYSVRDECEKDFPAVLEAVARMGYAGVEFAGYYGLSAKELKRILDDLNLEVAGTHAQLETLTGDELARTIDFNREIDNRFLIVPIVPDRKTRQGWVELAESLNDIAARLKECDMLTGYHNHAQEFSPAEGEMPWDIVFSHAAPEIVMQIDTGNALGAGADAVPYIEKYAGRALTVHLKEFTPGNDKALIGEGDVRWPEVFAACESVGGTHWYIVEQEQFAYPSLECARRNLEALRGMGK